MAPPIPAYCRPAAFGAFHRALADRDAPLGLFRAAAAISLHAIPEADVHGASAAVEGIAHTVQTRARSGSADGRLAHLHDVLFEVIGLRGAEEDYYNPANSYLPVVLSARRGIPIALSLIYRTAACLVGLNAVGVNAPGHFLAGVDLPNKKRMYVDPFYGGALLDEGEVFQRITATTGQPIPPSPELLRTATPDQWLSRMLMNLQAVFAQTGAERDLYAMQELHALLETH
ncbi:transglutaminase family protein [Pirellulimonas nuda]|uniref:transglutaminase family protein n=1 Tax=Pirellulimonas nuda TaxID=2528009 RepID=UPI0018D3910E|nr:transglutaminase-like domain-containing protein [Pirellulimonas nuda]